jgi:hypothetical protein
MITSHSGYEFLNTLLGEAEQRLAYLHHIMEQPPTAFHTALISSVLPSYVLIALANGELLSSLL